MKKLILSAVMVTGLAIGLQAQTNSNSASNAPVEKQRKQMSPEERAKADADRAQKNLALTPDQKNKWEAASLERINANKQYQDKLKGSTTPEERKGIHQSMKQNGEKFDNTVTAFLTPDQKTKFDQQKKERKERRGHHKGKKGDQPSNGGN